jgi:hypothetical protein
MLLPAELSLTGSVVDEDGKPVAGATIEHSVVYPPLAFRTGVSDQLGNFAIHTRAPFVVIRKPGYRSVRIAVGSQLPYRVTLAPGRGLPQACSQAACRSPLLKGRLCLTNLPGVDVGKEILDADHRRQGFFLVGSDDKAMIHGVGPTWSFGAPGNEEVWGSAEYEETTYDLQGVRLIDARGKMVDGKYWRYVGMPRESVSYDGLSAGEAAIFDQMLDKMCIMNRN